MTEGKKTITQIAADFDLTLRALRFYESAGLLSPERRGVQRFYDQVQERQVAAIVQGVAMGFTINEMKTRVRRGAMTVTAEEILEKIALHKAATEKAVAAIGKLSLLHEQMTGRRPQL